MCSISCLLSAAPFGVNGYFIRRTRYSVSHFAFRFSRNVGRRKKANNKTERKMEKLVRSEQIASERNPLLSPRDEENDMRVIS